MEALIRSDIAARPPVARNLCVQLGDLVDRGPDSRSVVAHLAGPAGGGLERRVLKGNHEELLLGFLRGEVSLAAWRGFGGTETLRSYGVEPRGLLHGWAGEREARAALWATLPPPHLAFLERLETTLVVGDYLFVHAGLRPGVPLARQDPRDLLWIREKFLDHGEHGFDKVVVHGHTPVEAPERLPGRINLDTGAYATGRLACAVLEGAACAFLGVEVGHARARRWTPPVRDLAAAG
jgi:serine/threonine protein phosphatase 1